MCFQQGLAAQLMLRRRGIPSVLYYGAAQDGSGLHAHVWVRDGDIDVIGGEIAIVLPSWRHFRTKTRK